MNAINTSSNSNTRFTINFLDKSIIGTKASFNKAGKGLGAEYEELTAKMAAHPDFELVIKEQKHTTTKAKRTYDGMNFHFMEDFISTLNNAETLTKEYNEVKIMAKNCGTKAYPLTKKWFLGKFGTKEKPFDMDKARDAIAEYRLLKAAEIAAKNLTNVPAAAPATQTENPTT